MADLSMVMQKDDLFDAWATGLWLIFSYFVHYIVHCTLTSEGRRKAEGGRGGREKLGKGEEFESLTRRRRLHRKHLFSKSIKR